MHMYVLFSELFEYTIEHASQQLDRVEREREMKMYKEVEFATPAQSGLESTNFVVVSMWLNSTRVCGGPTDIIIAKFNEHSHNALIQNWR